MENLTPSVRDLARYIDHTLLRPDAVTSDFQKLCTEALEYRFYAVCVPPAMVTFISRILNSSNIKICTVVGFPFGYNLNTTKSFETKMAIDQGADEIDMVLNISALKNKETSLVLDDISSVVATASGRPVKVILETCYLTNEEKVVACNLSIKAGARFVKTSTGYGPKGATKEDIILLCETVNGKVAVKASGGIRDSKQALEFISLGATRLGTGNSVEIVTNQKPSDSKSY